MTERHYSRTLYAIRGLPGSGKSTFARKLVLCVHDADAYHICKNTNVYQWDPANVPAAHADCQQRVEAALNLKDFSVAVANTFTQRWELEPYIKIAERTRSQFVVVSLFDGGLTDEELAARNIHGVPVETIARMRDRFEHDWANSNPLPPWERVETGSTCNNKVQL